LTDRAAAGHERLDLAAEVLVTGASGFLGRPLIAAIAASGRRVIGLCRRPDAEFDHAVHAEARGARKTLAASPLVRTLAHRGDGAVTASRPQPARPEIDSVRWVQGDVRDRESYLPHLRPGMAVFHLAALRPGPGRRRRDLEAVNVTACRDLARSCLERGTGRFVLVSAAHLHGPSALESAHWSLGGPALVGREQAIPGTTVEPLLGCYERSRRAGLLEVRRLVEEGLDAIALCPAIIFGPDHPSHPNRVTEELRRILNARRPIDVLIAGGTARRDLVYLDDVVAATLAAERLAPAGAELVLSGEAISHCELIERVLALAGRRSSRLRLSIPAPAALAVARAADRLQRNDPGCGHAAAVIRLLSEWRFESSRARELLGYRPTPFQEGLAKTLRWLHESGSAH
jgi:dihydroflavonol-4-reductase